MAICGHLCELDQEQKSPFEAQYQELMVKWRAAMEEYQYTLANGNTVEPKKVGEDGTVRKGDNREKWSQE